MPRKLISFIGLKEIAQHQFLIDKFYKFEFFIKKNLKIIGQKKDTSSDSNQSYIEHEF